VACTTPTDTPGVDAADIAAILARGEIESDHD
jgi:hypothetical protein